MCMYGNEGGCAWDPFVNTNENSICAKKLCTHTARFLMHSSVCMKQCLVVILKSLSRASCSDEDIKERCVVWFLPSVYFPLQAQLTSPHPSFTLLLIMPPFVLIEYLLAYLFLITDSRLSVLSNSSLQYYVHMVTHALLNAQLNPFSSTAQENSQWVSWWLAQSMEVSDGQQARQSFCPSVSDVRFPPFLCVDKVDLKCHHIVCTLN